MTYCLDLPRWTQITGQWLYDWQTLIAGLLAIAGAFFGARAIHRQILQAAEFEQAQLHRKHRAEMAVFGLALSQVCDAVIDAEHGSGRLLQNKREDRLNIYDGSQRFIISDDVINRLRAFIESTDDPRLVGLVSAICHNIQIRQSRQRGEGIQDADLVQAIADLAGIYAMCESLFRYARGEKVKPPAEVSWQQARSFLTTAGLPPHRFSEVDKRLELNAAELIHVWSLDD